MTRAILIATGLLLTWFALYGWLTSRSKTAPYQGRHGFADPADRDDPDGAAYVAQLRAASRFPGLIDDPDVPDERDDMACWDEDEPDAGWQPPRQLDEADAARLAATSRLTAGILADLGAALAGGSDDQDDGDTRTDLHAVATWGMTAQQKAAELASKYLTAEVGQ